MSLCSQDWCGNHENPPASAFWMMESQEWATTPSCCSIFTLSMLTFWLLAPTEVFFQNLCYVTWCGYGSLWSWPVFSCVGGSFHRLLYCTGHVWRQIGTSSLMLLGYNSILCRIKKKTKSHKFKKVSWSRLLDLVAPFWVSLLILMFSLSCLRDLRANSSLEPSCEASRAQLQTIYEYRSVFYMDNVLISILVTYSWDGQKKTYSSNTSDLSNIF